jgi:selenocysteine lyase/cysteine desulfurase
MYKEHFRRFHQADPDRLHFAAHSHHWWPDVTFEAQQRAWLDAAARVDRKWEHVLGHELPKAQAHVARVLGLSRPADLVFASSVHELVMRVISCLEERPRPLAVLTTDAEFHSFNRQLRRLEEAGIARAERVPAEPFATFPARFRAAAAAGGHDLVHLSQVFYNSGYVVEGMEEIVAAVPSAETYVVIDGYHGFMALPTALSAIEDRAFYTSGGYKYAMSGEGVCFLHCPPGYGERPVDTGWFAAFGELEEGVGDGRVPYSRDGYRFFGATFDHSGLYRLNAVMDLMVELRLTVDAIHRHVCGLQQRFLAGLAALGDPRLDPALLIPGPEAADRGNFLTLRTPEAGALHRRLGELGVVTDFRGDRLRFGFGLYHDPEDVDGLLDRLRRLDG